MFELKERLSSSPSQTNKTKMSPLNQSKPTGWFSWFNRKPSSTSSSSSSLSQNTLSPLSSRMNLTPSYASSLIFERDVQDSFASSDYHPTKEDSIPPALTATCIAFAGINDPSEIEILSWEVNTEHEFDYNSGCDGRRLSFISFASMVQAEQQQGGRFSRIPTPVSI
jgi:hypothetical protein